MEQKDDTADADDSPHPYTLAGPVDVLSKIPESWFSSVVHMLT